MKHWKRPDRTVRDEALETTRLDSKSPAVGTGQGLRRPRARQDARGGPQAEGVGRKPAALAGLSPSTRCLGCFQALHLFMVVVGCLHQALGGLRAGIRLSSGADDRLSSTRASRVLLLNCFFSWSRARRLAGAGICLSSTRRLTTASLSHRPCSADSQHPSIPPLSSSSRQACIHPAPLLQPS